VFLAFKVLLALEKTNVIVFSQGVLSETKLSDTLSNISCLVFLRWSVPNEHFNQLV